ncbi:unnamed protein product [Periconia digitata]|uniref:small monomeric GTPase n=1 Tax=Periconia digitata TaxID=1303443 RepID=A0A9W4XYR0_9PLEO|nr:unnamed protein product [Periconia digitata]
MHYTARERFLQLIHRSRGSSALKQDIIDTATTISKTPQPPSVVQQHPRIYDYGVLVLGITEDEIPTVLDNISGKPPDDPYAQTTSSRVKYHVDGNIVLLDYFGPDETVYTAILEQCMRTANGFMFLYNIASREGFEQIRPRYSDALRFQREPYGRKPLSFSLPAIIIGYNNGKEEEREVPKEKGELLARELGCKFVEIEKLEKNGRDAVHILIKEMIKGEELSPSRSETEEKGATEGEMQSDVKRRSEKRWWKRLNRNN